MNDYKFRIKRAIENYHKKQDEPKEAPKRKNKSPEKDVERECLEWLRNNGFSVDVFEAKATYSPDQERYLQQSMKQGIPDCIGSDPKGYFVAIEFKAPGRKSTLRPSQKKYLIEKIQNNAFAVCVQSKNELEFYYQLWEQWANDPSGRRQVFLDLIPCRKHRESTLF